MTSNLTVKVILRTTREGRFGDKPAHWILGEAAKLPGVEAALLDLRDFPLPFFDRPKSPGREGGVYPHPVVTRRAEQVAKADAYIVVSPEYNHGYPAVLKNAFDHIYPEWARKPIGFVSYGSAGGARAVEQLRLVAVELQMWPIMRALHLPVEVYFAAMKEPIPPNPEVFEPLRKHLGVDVARFFDDLLWATRALKAGCRAGIGTHGRPGAARNTIARRRHRELYFALMDWRERVIIDPQVLVGKPIVKGTRLSVQFLVDLLAQGWSEQDLLSNYPGLVADDIRACLAYASAVLSAEKVYPLSA